MKKFLFITIGVLSVILGIIGIFVIVYIVPPLENISAVTNPGKG